MAGGKSVCGPKSEASHYLHKRNAVAPRSKITILGAKCQCTSPRSPSHLQTKLVHIAEAAGPLRSIAWSTLFPVHSGLKHFASAPGDTRSLLCTVTSLRVLMKRDFTWKVQGHVDSRPIVVSFVKVQHVIVRTVVGLEFGKASGPSQL